MIVNESKMSMKNEWIDYKNADEIVPQTWIIERLNMYKISDKIVNLITNATRNRRLELIVGGQLRVEIKKKSCEVSSREIRFHHSYSLFQWCNSITDFKNDPARRFWSKKY